MAEPQLRLGIVGAGRRAQQHLATLRGLSDLFRVVAICDANRTVAEEVAGRMACDAFTDARECIAKARLDAVLITTPPEAHHLIAAVAARAGVPMLIETTLGLTRPMMDAIASITFDFSDIKARKPGEPLLTNGRNSRSPRPSHSLM